MTILAIRMRGGMRIEYGIKDTMTQLHISHVNHSVLLEENAVTKGMLQKVKDYTTWGPVSKESLAAILPRALKEPALKLHKFDSYEECAEAIISGKVKPKELFTRIRLHPARGGLTTIKRSYVAGGDLGNRGAAINELVMRMR